jgi:hypothetical protein
MRDMTELSVQVCSLSQVSEEKVRWWVGQQCNVVSDIFVYGDVIMTYWQM